MLFIAFVKAIIYYWNSMEDSKEAPVQIRVEQPQVDRRLGQLTLPMVSPPEAMPDSLFQDPSNCCEDCPEVNESPPDVSDCPYFEKAAGRYPECTRDDSDNAAIHNFFLR